MKIAILSRNKALYSTQRLVEAGPRVSDALRRFVDAAETGDVGALQAVVPEVSQALSEFTSAAAGSG